MKLVKPLFFLISAFIFTLACGAVSDILPASSVNAPTEILTELSSVTPEPTYTAIPTPVVVFSTPQALPFPAWVTDFSDPILAAVDDRQPDFHDEFSLLNRGWFYFIPGSLRNPFYAHLQDGTLLMKLPAENENKDYWVYNPKLIRKNFVLSFDFQFEETQPSDTVRFQFDQTADQSLALDLSKNQTWTLHWGSRNNWQSTTGTFDYLPPERIAILIIVREDKCAVYLNDAPLTYLSNCRNGAVVRSSPWAVTFHMLADPGHTAAVTIDNVKLWDLDKISGVTRP
jgi:hypothetical protein